MGDEVVTGEVDEKVAEEVAGEVVMEVVGMVVDEMDAEVVQPDVVVVDPNPSISADTQVTAPSTEPSVHIDGGFPG